MGKITIETTVDPYGIENKKVSVGGTAKTEATQPDGNGNATGSDHPFPNNPPTSTPSPETNRGATEAALRESPLIKESPDRVNDQIKWGDEYRKRVDDDFRSGLDPDWDKDHAKMKQLNGRSFNKTLAYSRLADAYNNTRHLKATDIGRRTLHYGATGTGADNAGSERWQPIETQEMRQMRENEAINAKARGYDVDRQNRVKNYAYDLSRDIDAENLNQNRGERDTIRAIWAGLAQGTISVEYVNKSIQHLQDLETRWQAYFKANYGSDIVNYLTSRTNDIYQQTLYAYVLMGYSGPNMTQMERAMANGRDVFVQEAVSKGIPAALAMSYYNNSESLKVTKALAEMNGAN